jgi:hypothetical protein
VSEIPASDELLDLVFAALDHGIDSVSEGGPLIPFALAETPEGRTLTRFATGHLEEGVAQAREHTREIPEATLIAIAYDGYLTIEGERSDAIFVEGQERGASSSVVFAQRYRPGGRLRKFSTIGNAAFAGEGDGLF